MEDVLIDNEVVATIHSYELGKPGYAPVPLMKMGFTHSERDKVVTLFQSGDIGECKLYENYYQKRKGNSYGSYTFIVREAVKMTKAEQALRVKRGENLRTSHLVYDVLEYSNELLTYIGENNNG